MLIQFFVLLFGGAVASLIGGIKYKRWLLTMFSTILFLVLAFTAFRIEVVSGGVTLYFEEIVIILLNWFGAIVAFIFTLVGMLGAFKDRNKKTPGPQYGGGY